MRWMQSSFLAVVVLLAIAATNCFASEGKLFSIISEHVTKESSREFSSGFCNASLRLNDHLYQLIGWCRQQKLGPGCLARGAVACLFKKYIDAGRKFRFMDGGMTSVELGKRLFVFRDNLIAVSKDIEARLADAEGPIDRRGAARFGITKFMHLSPAEFRDRYLTSLRPNATRGGAQSDGALRFPSRRKRRSDTSAFAARPSRVDWREKGVITGVKDQGPCGACWAFAVVEVAESQFALRYPGTLPALSVQQVTDCTRCGVCAGCRGGDICQAAVFYSGATERIAEDRLYPYVAKDGTCRQVTGGYQVQTAGVSCDSFVNHEDALLDHLWQSGTAAVAVDAHMWQYYVDGTIMHNCEADLNHAVQLIGYDVASGPVPFYLVRNSWGPDWGLAGYLQIAQGSNLCGLAQDVVSFTVA